MNEKDPDLFELMKRYRERSGEGSPVFGYPEEDAIEEMKKALRTGRRMPGVEKRIQKSTGLKPEEFDV